jgi:cobalt-zinc-cadmium resistance protein CzcA
MSRVVLGIFGFSAPGAVGPKTGTLEAPAVRRGVAHRLAGEVVSCRVVKHFGADTVTVSAAVREALADYQQVAS